MKKQNKIKFGIPWEYLRAGTVELLRKAGYEVSVDEHSYGITIDDPEIECVTSKVEELARWVEQGIFDIGITEDAFLVDSRAKVIKLVDLNFGYKTWKGAAIVLAVPRDSKIKQLRDLNGKKIATWTPNLVKDFFSRHKIKAKIIPTNMPAEAKCPLIFDGVVEFVNTGLSLQKFNLKTLTVLMKTSPWLIANKRAFQNKWKKEKIEDLAMLLKGARLAQDMAGLMLHASNKMLEDVFKILPALKKPTVTQLRGQDWFDVLTVADKKEIRKLIPELKKIGCTDIVEFPLDKVVP